MPQQHGVNLESFYGTRAAQETPRFLQPHSTTSEDLSLDGPLHVALVKISVPQRLDDVTLDGVAKTLSQLGKLGMVSAVVLDCKDNLSGLSQTHSKALRAVTESQVDRLVAAIDACGGPGARRLDYIISVSERDDDTIVSAARARGRVHVQYRNLLMAPLRKGMLAVIPAVGCTDETHRIVPIEADDVILALTRELAGLQSSPLPEEDPIAVADQLKALRSQVSLDRLIILDTLGGIPTTDRSNGYHVFLNLEQEFTAVKKYLLNASQGERASDAQIHLRNLELARDVLSLLPSTSSALLTTPTGAANSEKPADPSLAIGVGTRTQRNPLIHNLLTDRPVLSSSLPSSRLGASKSAQRTIDTAVPLQMQPTTFIKRGVSVSIHPDPQVRSWQPPTSTNKCLSLTDPRIDLPRLVHLINDSFDRTLDVEAYLKRVNDRIAGVIIAGQYEGGAILTWETPAGVPDDGSEESRARMVPYLDKFAVLKRSQGAGGVADIVFNSMVKDCFPDGVCWRSRRDNPVNKWYFERSRGTWKIPNTNWTMFWTTSNLDVDQQKFSDYESVCKSIEPSWADIKAVVD